MVFNHRGCPIRTSADQSSFATPRSFSQLTTSFVVSESLGIPHTLLFASYSYAISIFQLITRLKIINEEIPITIGTPHDAPHPCQRTSTHLKNPPCMQLSASRSHSGRGMNVICLVSLQCYLSQLARRQIMSTRTISIDFISKSFYRLLTKR